MAANKPSEFGLDTIMVRRGQGRGVDPATASAEPAQEEALRAVQEQAMAPEAVEEQSQARAGGVPALEALLFNRAPSKVVPTRPVQAKLKIHIARSLAAIALHEETSQQEILERIITNWVEEYLRARIEKS